MVTRKDVAAMAGVSVTAVSRVMNNSGYVAREKREAILKAVERLGYRPNAVAAANQKRLARQVLFYNKDLGNAYNIDMYRGMSGYAAQHGYMVVLSGMLDMEKILSMLIAGIIFPNEGLAQEYIRATKGKIPLPIVSASYGASTARPKRVPLVESDTHVAMELLLGHLMEKGHRKIALASPYPVTGTNPRSTAYRSKMLPILGDAIGNYIFVNNPTHTMDQQEEDYYLYGEQLARQFVERRTDATAIACFNDDMAIGMIQHFSRLGISVPGDISVGGIDGQAIGSYMHPRLTSVAISSFDQGRECVRVLLDMIAGKQVRGRTRIPIRLIEGESVRHI